MANERNINPNRDPNLRLDASTEPHATACDLHDAILANSLSVVDLYLNRKGADPNRSPLLPPVGVISSAETERARDLHRTLGRVFRRRQGGTIHPLHVAVCNAYHHCSFGREQALGIIRSLLHAGANTKALSNGIVYCKIGSHASITIASAKRADKVALFLKRFPLPNYERECCEMMDEVASLILQGVRTPHPSTFLSSPMRGELEVRSIQATYQHLLEDQEFTDITFQCPDGEVKAHKCVLASATPYFKTAFQGPWHDGSNNTWRTSNSVATMQFILKYLYTGRIEDDDEELSCHTILSVASEYQLELLERYCEDRLVELLSNDTISQALELSHMHHLKKLEQKCFEFIFENATTVLVKPEMMNLSTQNPELWKNLLCGLDNFRVNKRKRDEDHDSNGSAVQDASIS